MHAAFPSNRRGASIDGRHQHFLGSIKAPPQPPPVCLSSAFLAFYCFKMNRELSVMLNDSVLANLCLDTNNTVSLLYLVQNTHVSFHNLCTAVAALSLPLNPASLGDVNTARGTQGRTGEHCGRTTLLCLFEMTLFVSIALSNVPLQETSPRIPSVVPRETETYP
jgi:hypothetical protein